MITFSPPEERAVKAVLIHKNQKIAIKMLIAFITFLVSAGVYCIITVSKNNVQSAQQLFSDNIFTGIVVFCAFSLFLVSFFINVPITKRNIKDNGGYKTILEKDKIRVLFSGEPEIIVNLKDIDQVEEYDIFYLIHCYKWTDEIVCSKNLFEQGDDQQFHNYFKERGFDVQDKTDKKIYVSVLNKINGRVRAGYTSIIFSLICALTVFPLYWFVIKILMAFVPNLVSTIMVTLLDLTLIMRIVLGILFLPLALVATLIAGITSVGILGAIPLLLYASFYKANKQLKNKNKSLGVISLVVCVLVALFCIFILLLLIGVFKL